MKYQDYVPKYHDRNLKGLFDESQLPYKNIVFNEFVKTINTCNDKMMYYRGKIVKYDMIGYGAILLGFLILLLLGFATSSSEDGNWGNMVLYILLYFIFCPIIYKVSKCFQCKYLR